MNRFPFWKYVLLLVVLLFAVVYSLPNLYTPDPAVQIIGNSQGAEINDQLIGVVGDALRERGIEFSSAKVAEDGTGLVRLRALEDQLAAKTVIQDALRQRYADQDLRFVVALNQASNTPSWLSGIGAARMNLGLDLAGGVHFLLEVDTPKAIRDRLEDIERTMRKGIRDERLFGVELINEGNSFTFYAPDEETRGSLIELLKDNAPQLERRRFTADDGRLALSARMSETAITEIEDHAVSQNLTTIRNRVNELGVSEPLVQKQGRNRIVVELPGVQDTAGAKKILGKTANLEFRLEADSATPASQKERFDWYRDADQQTRGPAYLERQRIISGEHVVNAVSGFDQESNSPKIDITLNSEGGALMHHATRNEVGTNLGVVFIDYYTVEEEQIVDGKPTQVEVSRVDEKLISLATVRSALGARFQTTGLDSIQEASDLALLLRAGSLAAPMRFVEERTIGPSLGAENIKQGLTSVQLGLGLVVIFMLVYYRVFGIAANLALALNIGLIVAIMSLLGATLTLPGIAGIVLTIGMAVDANVLIFSRVKEELRNGSPPQTAIHAGYERAFTTILDANLTTLIVAFILFAIGTGPVKGFAITLSIGILTSMFTAIVGSRAVVNLIYGGRRVERLWI